MFDGDYEKSYLFVYENYNIDIPLCNVLVYHTLWFCRRSL